MDRNEIERTAYLAQVGLKEDEITAMIGEFSQMLEYFEIMKKIDVSGLEPTTHSLLKENRLREDREREEDISDSILEESPELEDRFIVIPNVL